MALYQMLHLALYEIVIATGIAVSWSWRRSAAWSRG